MAFNRVLPPAIERRLTISTTKPVPLRPPSGLGRPGNVFGCKVFAYMCEDPLSWLRRLVLCTTRLPAIPSRAIRADGLESMALEVISTPGTPDDSGVCRQPTVDYGASSLHT